MFRRGPLTFADDGQSGAVNDEVQAGARAGAPKREGEMLTASRERGVIGGREIDAQHPEDRCQAALGLTQRSVEDETERQGGFDGEIGLLELPAPPADASAQTQAQLDAWRATPLDALDLVGLLIDGVHVGGHCIVVARGIDKMGAKHPLGLWEGATENATVCQGLLTNLASRGLRTDRSLLVIVDGAKALDTAVTQTFGRAATVTSGMLVGAQRSCSVSSLPSVP